MYNRDKQIFEGIWDISAFAIERWNDGYYYAESNGPNVYKLFEGHSDVENDERFPIDFEVGTHFMNLTASKSNLQAMHGIMIEGYVAGGATFDFSVTKDFASNPFLTGTFAFTEEGLLDGEQTQAFLGNGPMAVNPLGVTISDPDSDGRRHFQWIKYFPYQYGNYFSVGFTASEADDDFEIIRMGLIVKEDVSVDVNKIKQGT